MIDSPAGADQLQRLQAIVHRLRAPGGCPWDGEQTHASIASNLIEETYEVVDAIQREDWVHLREELGDLLLQVVFHAEMGQEVARFDLQEIARGISEKLVRRHPHVFALSAAITTDQVLNQWDEIKRLEKGDQHEPYLHGVGKGLPSLLRAVKLQKKAAKVGFDWQSERGVIAKIREELLELETAMDSENSEHVSEELGDVIFSVTNLSRFLDRDPELILARANDKFAQRFSEMESNLTDRKISLDEATAEQMEEAWQQVKHRKI